MTRRLVAGALLLALVAGVSGCGKKKRQPRVPMPPAIGEAETGLASWYGHPYHGRPTASGEIYDMNGMTAAHRTLAFDTWVRVTNLENDLVTNVRINDRGPFIEGRIIDLSRAAAETIDMIGPGTALVKLEVIRQPQQAATAQGQYSVQVGAFLVEQNALRLQDRLLRKFRDVFIQTHLAPDGFYYRVRVGRKPSLDAAYQLAQQLRQEPEIASALVVRLN